MEHAPHRLEIQPNMVDLLTPETIHTHALMLSQLDRLSLLETLVPHRHLPEYDPARYLIDAHEARSNPNEPISSLYALGVVFGRSLISQAAREESSYRPIVISVDFNPHKAELVDDYLSWASRRKFAALLHGDPRFVVVLSSLRQFTQHCKQEFPDLDRQGTAELIKGAHDYLSVVRLLEADESEEMGILMQRLGFLQRFAGKVSLRNRKPDSRWVA